jgi:MFS transporter, ACS family, D-galactonate transporter
MKQKVGNVRWGIGILLGLGIIINYFDRTNISVATKPLMDEYHLSLGQVGILLSAFSWSYTILQIPVGAILDKVGVKWLNRVGTFLWALATAMTAVVSGMGLIILSRIILGVAECPAFPGASKATGYWFPLKERGLATSIFDGSAKLSNVLAMPLIAWAMSIWGWRGGFWFTAILSVVYGVIWWIWYRDPAEHKGLSEEERKYIMEGGAQETGTAEGGVMRSLGFLLKQRKVWGLTLGFAAYGYAFGLLSSWIPGYLETQMHMSLLKTGAYAIIPWIVAASTDVLIGGVLVDKLIAKGHDPNKVRKVLLVIGMLLGLAVGGAAFTTNPNVAIFWISLSLAGLAFAAPIGWSIPAIIAPKGTVGIVGGIMNFLNGLVGIFSTILTGYIAGRTGSFAAGFILAMVILFIGIFCYVFVLGKIEQIQVPFDNGNTKSSKDVTV